jgi:UDP-glucose 4-epimerase
MMVSGRRVLVTGGAGFIGSHVVRALLSEGNQVAVVDDFSVGRTEFLPEADPRLSIVRADVRNGAALVESFERHRPEVVVHLAAIHFIPTCDAKPTEAFSVNVDGTRNVLACALSGEVAAFFLASTAAVYAPHSGPHREDDRIGPIDTYGSSKRIAEELTELAYLKSGLPVAIGRLFNTYGPRETNRHLIPELLTQVVRGQPKIQLGNLSPRRDYVHVDDVARGILRVLEQSREGHRVFNIGTGVSHSVASVVEMVAGLAGREIDVTSSPDRLRTVDREDLTADTGRMSEIGWRPAIDLRTGLDRLIRGPAQEILVPASQ